MDLIIKFSGLALHCYSGVSCAGLSMYRDVYTVVCSLYYMPECVNNVASS